MSLSALIPTPGAVGREAVILIAGAVLAALVINQFPQLKTWLHDQWQPPRGTY